MQSEDIRLQRETLIPLVPTGFSPSGQRGLGLSSGDAGNHSEDFGGLPGKQHLGGHRVFAAPAGDPDIRVGQAARVRR